MAIERQFQEYIIDIMEVSVIGRGNLISGEIMKRKLKQ
jgi:hypothetical protein